MDYQEFNNFQTAFYTSTSDFADFSRFEVKRNGYILLNNMGKGFPNLAHIIFTLKGINWTGVESPAILQALQRVQFVNGFNTRKYLPQFIYFKSLKEEKQKDKIKKVKEGNIFSDDIKAKIMSILFIDSKTYDYLKFGDKIQKLGLDIANDKFKSEKISKKKGK
jgi:hypothetical protein